MLRKHKLLLFSVILATILLASVVYGIIKFTQSVPSSGNILPSWSIALWRTDMNAALLSLNFSDIQPDTSKATKDIYGAEVLKIKNWHSLQPCWVAWELDASKPLPLGVSISALVETSSNVWGNWDKNDYGSVWVANNSLSERRIEFVLTANRTATGGPFTFNLLLYAADSGSG